MAKKPAELRKKSQEIIRRLIRRVFRDELIGRIRDPFWRRVVFNWKHVFSRLLPLGGLSEGNKIALYSDGDMAFSKMCESIGQAKKLVWLEMYIFSMDRIGRLIRDALVDAAQRGCEVLVIYDHFGSPRLNEFLAPLHKAGGKSFAFNPIWPWRKHGPLLFRDHRKILIIDGEIGYCGGLNISEEYAGRHLGTNRFRDTLLGIKGPGVADLGKLFVSSLQETAGIERHVPAAMVSRNSITLSSISPSSRGRTPS